MVPEKQSFISEIIIYLKDWMSLNKKNGSIWNSKHRLVPSCRTGHWELSCPEDTPTTTTTRGQWWLEHSMGHNPGAVLVSGQERNQTNKRNSKKQEFKDVGGNLVLSLFCV